jgi:hypothetical protein
MPKMHIGQWHRSLIVYDSRLRAGPRSQLKAHAGSSLALHISLQEVSRIVGSQMSAKQF